MRRLALWALLVAVWVLLWDRVTVGQVLAGAAVAALVLLVLPTPPAGTVSSVPVRPVATLRLLGWFTVQFVVSNFQVARASLLPRRYVRTGVVRVELRRASPTLAALVSNLCALSPGLQPVDASGDPLTLHVHVLMLRSEEEAQAFVHHLEELVLAAFGPAIADDLGAIRTPSPEEDDRDAPEDGSGAGSDPGGRR
jgi:multicomponent Na+:H+ antiporter subunit E